MGYLRMVAIVGPNAYTVVRLVYGALADEICFAEDAATGIALAADLGAELIVIDSDNLESAAVERAAGQMAIDFRVVYPPLPTVTKRPGKGRGDDSGPGEAGDREPRLPLAPLAPATAAVAVEVERRVPDRLSVHAA